MNKDQKDSIAGTFLMIGFILINIIGFSIDWRVGLGVMAVFSFFLGIAVAVHDIE
jgi:hypothetical protein